MQSSRIVKKSDEEKPKETSSVRLKRHIRDANWFMVIYLTLTHLLTLLAVLYIFEYTWKSWVAFSVLYYLSGVGITAGAHRLWAHRSYKASFIVRVYLMICNSMANQGSILHWARDHRVHHKYAETDHDPHDATRVFFYAHVGWLLLKKSDKVKEAGKKLDFQDLYDDPVVMFQHKLDPLIEPFFCFAVPTLIGTHFCDQGAWSSFLFLGVARYCCVLNSTWLVNSLAHWIGYKPYDKSINPTENPYVSFFALGEGWHNWHHVYPWDYATSEFGIWQRWNPTKLQIDIFAFLGLVWDRKRAVDTWNAAKLRLTKQNAGLSEYLTSAKNVLTSQQTEIAKILESAKVCFENQQAELRELLENAKKNCSVENMMDSARQTVEIQQAEFNSLIDSAKMLFESQQNEITAIVNELPINI